MSLLLTRHAQRRITERAIDPRDLALLILAGTELRQRTQCRSQHISHDGAHELLEQGVDPRVVRRIARLTAITDRYGRVVTTYWGRPPRHEGRRRLNSNRGGRA